jgi:hypothetical protein
VAGAAAAIVNQVVPSLPVAADLNEWVGFGSGPAAARAEHRHRREHQDAGRHAKLKAQYSSLSLKAAHVGPDESSNAHAVTALIAFGNA